MVKPPYRAKSPPKPSEASPLQEVPRQNVQIISDALGVDVVSTNPEEMRAFVRTFTRSMSTSPYTSAEMLQEYRDRGFPDLPERVLDTIDRQILHRQRLETSTTDRHERRLDRAQWGAQALGMCGLVGSLAAGYLGAPTWLCSVVIVMSIGGPNAATIVSKVLEKLDR